MKLEANGMRVETKGKAVVNYSYLGMGISFEDMSEKNRAHLKRLLDARASLRDYGTGHCFLITRSRHAGRHADDLRSRRGHSGSRRILRKPPGTDARGFPQTSEEEPDQGLGF